MQKNIHKPHLDAINRIIVDLKTELYNLKVANEDLKKQLIKPVCKECELKSHQNEQHRRDKHNLKKQIAAKNEEIKSIKDRSFNREMIILKELDRLKTELDIANTQNELYRKKFAGISE